MDEDLSLVNVQSREKSAFCNVCYNFLEKESIGKTVFSAGGDGFSNWKKPPRNSKIIARVISTGMQKGER